MIVFFFQAEDGIRDLVRSRGLGDVYKRQALATQTGAAIEASRGSEPRFAVWLVAGPLVALILSLIHI